MADRSKDDQELETLEIDLLLEALFRRYGYDFRQYAVASRRRRILAAVAAEGAGTISALLSEVLHEPAAAGRLLEHMTVHTTAMFRDPGFYRAFRTVVVPWLRDQTAVRIWHAGCSTGEEVYSMAILLEEEGLLESVRTYATDLTDAVLKTARAGIYPLSALKAYDENYRAAGGRRSLADYYTAAHRAVRLRPSLRKQILFAVHDLATEASFNEFHVVVCRNVMIYFQKPLQVRAHRVIYDSLAGDGFLAIGLEESMTGSPHERAYEIVEATQKIFRKVAGGPEVL